MADGLSSALGDIGSESILDNSLSNADLANDAVSGAKIADGGIDYSKITSAMQAGSNATGAGSEVWVEYPSTFASIPQSVVCTTKGDTSAKVSAGSIGAGSFIATSHDAASVNFSWLAVDVA